MEQVKPSRPTKVKNPPVPKPLSKEDEATFEVNQNKYAPRRKVGRATLGGENRVETVGLGNLTVITTNGYTDV